MGQRIDICPSLQICLPFTIHTQFFTKHLEFGYSTALWSSFFVNEILLFLFCTKKTVLLYYVFDKNNDENQFITHYLRFADFSYLHNISPHPQAIQTISQDMKQQSNAYRLSGFEK
jgi:hypothetical protein